MKKLHRFLIEAALLPVKFYQKCISPRTGPHCKYRPTCSSYALEALREWGILAGTALAVWRILRCNPFSKGGYDPVPRRKDK
ncbi:MAG: membrane protein insertion efficiency factor YidD [Clostridia bacterium]|nr:membrane protein insertion efficiency factor YidD [Clostridia bacterium]